LSLCGIGLCVFLIAILISRWAPYQVALAQVAASDWFLVRAGGPRLGARPVRDDISLVLFDMKSAAQLGYDRTHEDYVRLYRKLFADGAQVVYDTRTVAAADEAAFEEVKPLFDGMLAIRSDGSLLRDFYLGAILLVATHPRYTRLL